MNTKSQRSHSVYIYPGSFDPATNGHLDIISRASKLCERLIVAIGRNREKRTLFSVDERLDMLSGALPGIDHGGNVEIVSFSGLLVEFAAKCGANVIVKGLRAMSDFEYEFQMALLNKHMDDELETIFMMTNIQYTYLSSSAVKELALNGANVSGLVPDNVYAKLKAKVGGFC
ncbi:MAG: pantetheine-phosphate adenylyltransferase [Clostridiales bacterium]|nr:pantetheine-phosphate adenylyltransferase [Clostridiales bacterium]